MTTRELGCCGTLVLAACAPASDVQSGSVSRTTRADTVVVRTAGVGAPPLIAEVAAPAVAYLPEERAELQAIADQQAARAGAPRAIVPRNKQPVKGPFVDPRGRIWLQRSATAVKAAARVGFRSGPDSLMVSHSEPSVYAAFEPDGTFLGEVLLPMGMYPGFTGDFAWVIIEDADGVPRLVKYRVGGSAGESSSR